MGPSWTFGRKLGLGFAVVVGLGLLVSATAIYALRMVVEQKNRVITDGAQLLDAQVLDTAVALRMSANRGYFLTKDDLYLRQRDQARETFDKAIERIKAVPNSEDELQLIKQMEDVSAEQTAAADGVIARRRDGAPLEEIIKAFPVEIVPKAMQLQHLAGAFKAIQERTMKAATEQAQDRAALAVSLVIGMAAAAVLAAVVVAVVLSRLLSRQIGSAVQHIQSSSSELQAAANQQTTGAQEQVASMNEISTTIRELLSTAKQIAESAQRVAKIAADSAVTARAGDNMVVKAQSDVASIRQQVDLIVNHMLDLGRNSQRIGGILEIINELAEQTNILAINATIEAAGAGEAGKRFSVVADEIRKLADRVGGSTKEIRALIDEVRSAVNTTVMATETGSKAVDVGVRQFGEVTSTFRQITELLMTTTQAAREIELSTKQQTTAVEQVNIAVTNVAQASRESEASSNQVLGTVGELTSLSRDLARLVRPNGVNGHA
jgi:methyl-accepting chemotaxis protein